MKLMNHKVVNQRFFVEKEEDGRDDDVGKNKFIQQSKQ
jgi:hypothetical protein